MVSFSVYYGIAMVGDRGFEPLRISPRDFKSLVSTHFTNRLKYLVSPVGFEPT